MQKVSRFAIRGNWSTGISAPAEEILRLRVNEKSRYGTSAIREQPEVGGARLVLERYCRKRVDVIQIQEDFISEGINDHNAAWPRYIAHNEARRGYGLDKPVSRQELCHPSAQRRGVLPCP